MKTYVVILALAVLLAGCASPQAAPTPIIQTVIVTEIVQAPTYTPYPTYTPIPSQTPYPTYTPAPPVVVTATPVPPTPTPRMTDTPTRPPTATLPPTATPRPTNTPLPTKTPDVRAQYRTIDIRELAAYPDKHIDEMVKLYGKVFNIKSDFFQINVQVPGGSIFDTEAVVITFYTIDLPDGIYKDTYVTIYGTVTGTFEGTNTLGGTITQPMVDAEIIEKQ